ncbi:MAG: thioredoxin family protein [Chlorobiales bacterium]|nr:thioredoxin family protein [Chlorobiales bacterium]
MKTIKILGSGCAKCKQAEAIVKEVIAAEGIDATVEKVEDIQKIMAYNVMITPAVVIDEVVKIKGKVPSKEEIKALLCQ